MNDIKPGDRVRFTEEFTHMYPWSEYAGQTVTVESVDGEAFTFREGFGETIANLRYVEKVEATDAPD